MYGYELPRGPQLPFPRPPGFPAPQRTQSGARALLVLVGLFLLSAGGYAIFKYVPALFPEDDGKSATPVITPVQPASATIPAAEAEDLLHHLEAADTKVLQATAEMKRSEEWMARISPALERNFLDTERRRVDAATNVLVSARRTVEEAREELEIARNLLAERSKP